MGGAGLAADCTALKVEGGKLLATRPVFAGKATQTVSFPKSPAISATAAAGSDRMPPTTRSPDRITETSCSCRTSTPVSGPSTTAISALRSSVIAQLM